MIRPGFPTPRKRCYHPGLRICLTLADKLGLLSRGGSSFARLPAGSAAERVVRSDRGNWLAARRTKDFLGDCVMKKAVVTMVAVCAAIGLVLACSSPASARPKYKMAWDAAYLKEGSAIHKSLNGMSNC